MVEGIFTNREAARTYARNNLPLQVNPFAIPKFDGFAFYDDTLCINHWDDAEDSGFDDPPTIITSGDLAGELLIWSNSETPFDEFTSLCRSIDVNPPDISYNPQETSSENADVLQRIEKQIHVQDTLYKWWEDQQGTMTDKQKAAIWRKLHPRPYEIVPVPLEKEG